MTIRFVRDGQTVTERSLSVSKDSFEPVILPWPAQPLDGNLDLEILCAGPSAAFIAAHFELDRKILVDRCKGRGVELGPGPKPQILPGPDVAVSFIEQKSPDEWVRLYGDHYADAFDPALAPMYVVGDAHEIPAATQSLDFIFSSHVFEHLVNPIGHLRLWSGLLREGGEVLMVIPDYIGSKDYLAEPSHMSELLLEDANGSFAPTMDHYRRYARSRNAPDSAQKLYDAKSSIHTHFYSQENMAELLAYSVAEGMFANYSILHSRNAKDFHVILSK